MHYPKVAIIIVNWNNYEDTVECLRSVLQIDYSTLDIVVVDNGSNDGSAEKILDYFLKMKNDLAYLKTIINDDEMSFAVTKIPNASENQLYLLENDKNEGPTGGYNIGIYYSIKYLDPAFCLLLNNDTIVDKNIVKNLISHILTDNNIAITQGKILTYSDRNKIDGVGNELDIFGTTFMRGGGEEDTGQYDDSNYSGFFYAVTTCMIVRREYIEAVGEREFFDQVLFGFQEDVDACWMARLLGWEISYCPDARCYHKWGRSFSKVESSRSYFLNRRNQIRLLLKNYQLTTILFILPIEFSILLFSNLILSVGKHRKYFVAFLNAMFWNVTKLPSTIRKRRIVQKKRTVTDRAILKKMDFTSYEFASYVRLLRMKLKD